MKEELMHFSLEIHNIAWYAPLEVVEKNLPSCVYANIEAKDMNSLVETEVYRFLEKQFGYGVDSFLPKEIKVIEYDWVGERVIKQFFDEPKDSYETSTDERKYAIIYNGVNGDKKCLISPNRQRAISTMHSMVMNFLSSVHYDIDASFRYQSDNPFCSINDGEYVWHCIPISD